MGLDMSVTGRCYIAKYDEQGKRIRQALREAINELNVPMGSDVHTVEIESAYWRKANAIHNWLVQNIQHGEDDCREYHFSKENMQKLLTVCETILAADNIEETAMELLPPVSGFFFGSTEIDRWYLKDLEYTVERMKELMKPEYDNWVFYYQASW